MRHAHYNLSKYDAHRDPLFIELSLLKLNDPKKLYYLYCRYCVCKLYCVNCIADICSKNIPKRHRQCHYDLRNENISINPEVRTRSGENCIRYYLPRLVNSAFLRNCLRILTMATLCIKRNVISNYAADCTIPNCYICSRRSWVLAKNYVLKRCAP